MIINEYEGRCGSCDQYTFEGENSKGHCRAHEAYYYPDDSCGNWKEKGSTSGGTVCFLTTACCSHKGLPDNCYELESLRKFRDTYLKEQSYGEKLIRAYYRDAPGYVKKLNEQPDKDELYENIYQQILEIVRLLEAEKYTDAVVDYMFMVYSLKCLLSER